MKNLEHKWDLGALFADDAAVKNFCEELKIRAKNFEKSYKNSLSTQKISDFPEILAEYETIFSGVSRVMTYAFLEMAADSKRGGFFAECELKCNEIQAHVLFFDIEFCALDPKIAEEIRQSAPKYAYFLENMTAGKKYLLNLDEEKIMLNLAPLGGNAFARLFDEFFSNLKIKFHDKNLSEEEILALGHDGNRATRKEAQEAFTAVLRENSTLLTYILNMIRKDKNIHTTLRHYENKEIARHIGNQISQKSVDSLIASVNDAMDLSVRYYALKGQILNISLEDYDRYAPIVKNTTKFSYETGLSTVLDAFADFSPKFHEIATRAVENGWIDSHPRDGKRSGAFSHGAVPEAHPYVLLNFTGNRRDVFTIAHEFGHMIHQELSKEQGYLNMHTPLTTAETASVFAEMVLFDKMKKELPKEDLREIYASKLEDIIATLFRQIVMTNFERAIHEENGELKTEDFSRIWLRENARMFGDAVHLTQNYALWWSYIPHFVHTPFYCYAYSYGQLLVLALFGLYKSAKTPADQENFKQKYIEFLGSGGSKSPRDLISNFGFDIEDGAFWQVGLREVQKLINEFEALI